MEFTMWKTVIFLVLTLLLAPYLAYLFDQPPTEEQGRTIHLLAIICLSFIMVCFITSTLTQNYSQVDKLWSIMPIIYSWVVAWQGNWELRLVIMASLVSVWGIRLTYNFYRRGGYHWKVWKGEEDYRWAVLRQKKEFQSPIRWMMFNLVFISFYQMTLILLFTIPIVKSMEGSDLNIWDVILGILFLLFVVLETIADQQQWNFHKMKRKNPAASKGFLDKGLWSLVRHPNYASEQGIWMVFYCFSINATGIWVNWSIIGCILLILLFKGSSDFSEKISAEKYPGYKHFQETTPRFIPFT